MPITLSEGVRVVLAPNPSRMTYWGTNTYVLGARELVVIDPGPDDAAHLQAILSCCGTGQRIATIVVTHAHRDHSPLARRLAAETGAPVLAFGDPLAGRSDIMVELAASGLMEGGEGVDSEFVPDEIVADGDSIDFDLGALRVIHTPGHFGNHICLGWGETCFTGDHIMGWASSLVSPPDGDLTDFMASCATLRARPWTRFLSGHGAPMDEPIARLDWLIAHRKGREADIVKALSSSAGNAGDLARHIYHDVNPALLPAAERNVLAHLVDLYQRGLVTPDQALDSKAVFHLK